MIGHNQPGSTRRRMRRLVLPRMVGALHVVLVGCTPEPLPVGAAPNRAAPSAPAPDRAAPSAPAPMPGSRTDPVFQPPSENWVILSESRREVIWGHPPSRVRDGQRARIWTVINNREVEPEFPAMKSMRGLSEFDCATRLHRSIEVTAFDQPGGNGRILERSTTPSKWSPVSLTAHLQRVMARACAP